MMDLQTIESIHNTLIDRFGGSTGVRDLKGLEAAIARPYATFDGNELYADTVEKAAAIFESLIINHPFVDGNKRISYFIMRLVLLQGEQDLVASQEEKYAFVIDASKGELKFEEIKEWLYNHLLGNESSTLGIP